MDSYVSETLFPITFRLPSWWRKGPKRERPQEAGTLRDAPRAPPSSAGPAGHCSAEQLQGSSWGKPTFASSLPWCLKVSQPSLC